MSTSSYRRNRELGVTGRYTPTCLPAALEQLTPHTGFDPEVYIWYSNAMDTLDTLQAGQARRQINPALKRIYQTLADELDLEYQDLVFDRFRSLGEFKDRVGSWLRHGHLVQVDIMAEGSSSEIRSRNVHAVGIKAVGRSLQDGFVLYSTWVPRALQGRIYSEDLFPYIAQIDEPPRERYAFQNCNAMALPAA